MNFLWGRIYRGPVKHRIPDAWVFCWRILTKYFQIRTKEWSSSYIIQTGTAPRKLYLTQWPELKKVHFGYKIYPLLTQHTCTQFYIKITLYVCVALVQWLVSKISSGAMTTDGHASPQISFLKKKSSAHFLTLHHIIAIDCLYSFLIFLCYTLHFFFFLPVVTF